MLQVAWFEESERLVQDNNENLHYVRRRYSVSENLYSKLAGAAPLGLLFSATHASKAATLSIVKNPADIL